jgi:hypothetical protein
MARGIQAMVVGTSALVALSGPTGWALITASVGAAATAYAGLGKLIDDIADDVGDSTRAYKNSQMTVDMYRESIRALSNEIQKMEELDMIAKGEFSIEDMRINLELLKEELLGLKDAGKEGEFGFSSLGAQLDIGVKKAKELTDAYQTLEEILGPIRDEEEKIQEERKKNKLTEQTKLYEDFTSAMSKRYRKEQELIRITRKEQEAMNEAYTKAMLKRGRINDEVMTKQETALTSFTEGFKEQMNAQGTALEQFNQAGKRAFDSFADTLANTLVTGKFAFQDFARSVILDISRIIAKQMILIALQKAAGFFSFGGFSLGGLLGGRAGGGSVNKNQPYMVGEKGPEMFVPSGSGKIVPNNQISNAQPVNVNFNINTVDARGFNELLVNSRGLIVNMINSAVNEKGKMAIV